jgi:WD40 repeat protein
VKVWDARTGQILLTLEGHTSVVFGVAHSPDGSLVVSGGADRTVKVWDASTGQNLLTLEGHRDDVYCVAYSPDGSRVVSGSGDMFGSDSTARVWDVRTGRLLALLPCLDRVVAFWFHPTQPILHVADRGLRTGNPNVYVLELVLPLPQDTTYDP